MKTENIFLCAILCFGFLHCTSAWHSDELFQTFADFAKVRSNAQDFLYHQMATSQHVYFDHVVINERLYNLDFNTTGHIFVFNNAQGKCRFFEPLKGCGNGKFTVSETSEAHGCDAAMNAGFFDVQSGACLGSLIVDNCVVQDSGPSHPSFGLTTNSSYVIGYVDSDTINDNSITSLVTGVGWLVRSNQNYLEESFLREDFNTHFRDEMAPRVAIGHDSQGLLYMVEIDGDEPTKKGFSLQMFTQFLLSLKLENAVNLDGGGSATVLLKDQCIGKCSDPCAPGEVSDCPWNPAKCQRKVTSISCYRSAGF
eukprot:GCRY01001658.1.p1 GENE.GCRY01001658.1~~GCRY01001658.1.p1  ORF type:complete len:343 (-),score=33.05 GCRY01001658.1:27-956(-)